MWEALQDTVKLTGTVTPTENKETKRCGEGFEREKHTMFGSNVGSRLFDVLSIVEQLRHDNNGTTLKCRYLRSGPISESL